MPEKDWRTDNWAGHKPTRYRYNDPNLHFPRTTREIGWGDYQPSLDKIGTNKHINWWVIAFFFLLFIVLNSFGAF